MAGWWVGLNEGGDNVIKTHKKHFEIFKAEAGRWLAFWGMVDWEVSYRHVDLLEYNCLACCWANVEGRLLSLQFSTQWEDSRPLDRHEISKVAFHEVCEGMLAELGAMAERYVVQGEVARATHGVIRRLENVVFEREYRNRKGVH